MATLSVKDVSLNFGGIMALDGISFDVEPRQICGLIGPNGAAFTSRARGRSGSTTSISSPTTRAGSLGEGLRGPSRIWACSRR